MKRIVCPIDCSVHTVSLVEYARDLAETMRAELILLHIEPPEPDFVGYSPGPQYIRDGVAKEFHSHHEYIQHLAETYSTESCKLTSLVIQGATAQKILEKTEELQADCLIMNSHGHGALYNVLVGSVLEEVLHHTRIPVLVRPVKKKDEDANE